MSIEEYIRKCLETIWQKVTQRMAFVPAGEFICGESGKKIYLDAFYIDLFPVTNNEYKLFDALHEYEKGKEDHPVVNVTWYHAMEYSKWIGKRLPTELEWEKAARGIDGRLFPWGNTLDHKERGNFAPEKWSTTPVDKYESGKSPYGVYDMLGNVWEWTDSWYDKDRKWVYPLQTGTWKALRGVSYDDMISAIGYPKITQRSGALPEVKNDTIGFRCAIDVLFETDKTKHNLKKHLNSKKWYRV